MLYAKVVLGLPIEGPFDYIVPFNLHKKIKVGMRVWVPFRTRRMVGYIVRLTHKTDIKNLKSILEIIDDLPILDKNMLSLTKELSDYYCCTFGEAIETAIPEGLRKGRKLNADSRRLDADGRGFLNEQNLRISALDLRKSALKNDSVLIHDLDGKERWEIYIREIKGALANNKSIIFLCPDKDSVIKVREIIRENVECSSAVLYRKLPKELEEWVKIKKGEVKVVIGTRSGIFAPVGNLGLIIIDEEQDSAYKQDQVPYYHAREVAFMRIRIEGARFILGSAHPSLESLCLARKNKIQYIFPSKTKDLPEVKLIDTNYLRRSPKERKIILSRYLEDSIIATFNSGDKTLLFLNRMGFATFAFCPHCGLSLKCERCNINLVFHFKDNILKCHYCNFKMPPPNICPNCNSGYIRYSGIGTEKIESELSRLFPAARIKRLDKQSKLNLDEADIFISSRSIIKQTGCAFDLIGALFIDNSLNRIDFRSGEKTFGLLTGLLRLARKRFIIQTNLPNHYCLKALLDKNIDLFYAEELKQRKQLNFPPFKHLGLVKLRGEQESHVRGASEALFKRLAKHRNRGINIISVNPGQPSKLRGKFYWQILIKSDSAKKMSGFLKKRLKDFSRSGIIVTVDIDPI